MALLLLLPVGGTLGRITYYTVACYMVLYFFLQYLRVVIIIEEEQQPQTSRNIQLQHLPQLNVVEGFLLTLSQPAATLSSPPTSQHIVLLQNPSQPAAALSYQPSQHNDGSFFFKLHLKLLLL
jgi:hypothetical protein